MPNDEKKPELSIFDHRVILLSTLISGGIFSTIKFYNKFLKPIKKVSDIPQNIFKNKTLFGKVIRVGDGDNFHFYHTPGGIWGGWYWLRYPPKKNTRGLKGKTLHVRLCGVDAPERAHFGKPSQPYSDEALEWLKSYILGKKIRIKPLSLDQYGRVVGKATIWTIFGQKNISLEMVKNGWATVYEGKSTSQFDGEENLYKKHEIRAKLAKKGMWCKGSNIITPREYKKLHSS